MSDNCSDAFDVDFDTATKAVIDCVSRTPELEFVDDNCSRYEVDWMISSTLPASVTSPPD